MRKIVCCLVSIFTFYTAKPNSNLDVKSKVINDILINHLISSISSDIPNYKTHHVSYAIYGTDFTSPNVLFDFLRPILNRNPNLENVSLYPDVRGNLNFVPPLGKKSILIKVRNEERLLSDIYINHDDDKLSLSINPYTKPVKKTFVFYKGELNKAVYRKYDKKVSLRNEHLDENITKTVVVDSVSNKHQICKNEFEGDLLSKYTIYEKGKSDQDLKIESVTDYCYNENGLLLNSISRNKNGGVIDSTQYYYDGQLLKSIISFEKNTTTMTYFNYEDELLNKIQYKGKKSKVEVKYKYDERKRLISVITSDLKWSNAKKVEFGYDSNSRLITVHLGTLGADGVSFAHISKYEFEYNETKFVKSIIKTDSYGDVVEKINYSVHTLYEEMK